MVPRTLSPIIAAVIITSLGGLNMGAYSLRPIYNIQLVLTVIVVLSIFLWLKSPRVDSTKTDSKPIEKGSGFLQDFREVFKGEVALKRYLAFSIVSNFGTNVVTAFIPLWMVKVKGADAYTLGLVTAAGMITAMFLQIPVGRLSDKIGRKKPIIYSAHSPI